MNKYKHIFFDLDRTLWDYEQNAKETIQFQLSMHGALRDVKFNDFFPLFDKYNEEGWVRYIEGKVKKEELRMGRFTKTLHHFKIDDLDLAQRLSDEFISVCPTMPHLTEGSLDTLEYLANKNYQLHILTNGFSDIQYTKLRSSQIEHFFTRIITSDEVHCCKPNKEIFHLAITSLNAKKNASLMVGDDYVNDILGAMQYGIDQAWLNLSGKECKRKPTYEIQSIAELKAIL